MFLKICGLSDLHDSKISSLAYPFLWKSVNIIFFNYNSRAYNYWMIRKSTGGGRERGGDREGWRENKKTRATII